MLRFEREQKVYKIGEVQVGGQPGQLPTLLVGNVFYKGMPEVTDHKSGRFDRVKVSKWIETAEELAERLNMPHIIDVTAMFPEAMEKYVLFIVERTEKPLMVDGASPEVRIAGIKLVNELGLNDKVIFNAFSLETTNEEIEILKECNVKACVLLAENQFDFSPEGRVLALKGFEEQPSLLERAEKAGMEKFLVDTLVFDVPSIAYAAEAIKLVKEELGLPAGCSPANATFEWRSKQPEYLKRRFAAYNASAHSLIQYYGADFILYGPIKQAGNIIPTCAMNDAIIAYYMMRKFKIKPLTEKHPIYKIFSL